MATSERDIVMCDMFCFSACCLPAPASCLSDLTESDFDLIGRKMAAPGAVVVLGSHAEAPVVFEVLFSSLKSSNAVGNTLL